MTTARRNVIPDPGLEGPRLAPAARPAGAAERPRPPRVRRRAPRGTSISLLTLACSAAVVAGWLSRKDSDLVPDAGLGYALGIGGLAMMALLCVYSLRKRAYFARHWGPNRYWLLTHMWLGLLGPTLVIFHSNFKLGSLNSKVALFSVLLVAASGVVGRLVYTRVHYGLTDRRATLEELQREAKSERSALHDAIQAAPPLAGFLSEFESFALGPARGILHGTWRILSLRGRTRDVRSDARRALAQAFRRPRRDPDHRQARRRRREAERAIDAYLLAARRVSSFTVYERIFSLWHALHLPFCYLLFGSAAIHVVAVHMY